MVTLHGIALIAELIAAAWLAIALAGFAKSRAAPWLACATLALIIAALVVIEAST